jgi:hypothetical protein
MARYLRTDTNKYPATLGVQIRNDIPEYARQKVFQDLILSYRVVIGPEPEQIHKLEKPTAIGMLEDAIRTGQPLPMKVMQSGRLTKEI